MSNEIFIDGDADEIQLRVQGVEDQTNPLQTWEDSDAQVLAQIDADGQLLIDGQQDQVQVRVQGHSTQTEALQTWEDSAGNSLVQIAGDGRLELGTLDMGTPDALIEANHDITLPSSTPLQGMQSRGVIRGVITNAIAWIVQELELLGTGGVNGLYTALRAQISQKNTGDADQAELRAGDFEAINETGSSSKPVGKLIGLQATVSNEQNAHLTDAVGVGVQLSDDNPSSQIQNVYGIQIGDMPEANQASYAIHTGSGPVHLGDYLEVVTPSSVPAQPTTDMVRIYPKDDGKVYAKNWQDVEYDLTGGTGSVGIPNPVTDTLSIPDGYQVLVADPFEITTGEVVLGEGAELVVLDRVQNPTPQIQVFVPGELSVGNLIYLLNPYDDPLQIVDYTTSLGIAPAGSDVEIETTLDGALMFGASGINVAVGDYVSIINASNANCWPAKSRLKFEVKQIGSSSPGSHINIAVRALHAPGLEFQPYASPLGEYARSMVDSMGGIYASMQEVSGNTAYVYASTAGDFNGTIYGATIGQDASPELGKSILFDGVNDYLHIWTSAFASLFNPLAGTLIIFARVADSGVWADGVYRRMAYFGADANNIVAISKTSSINQVQTSYLAGGLNKTVLNTVLNGSTEYFMIAITWDTVANEVKSYMNGVQVGNTLTSLGTWSGTLGSQSTVIGAANVTPVNVFSGNLCHGILLTSAASAQQLLLTAQYGGVA